MSMETVQCGKRMYVIESRITKNGHTYIMVTEKSFGRLSKVMVFHNHYEIFRAALDRAMAAKPVPEISRIPVLA